MTKIAIFAVVTTGVCAQTRIDLRSQGRNTMTLQLGDLQVTRTNATTLTVGANCSTATPCNVRLGNVVTAITDSKAVTNPSGSGMVYLYIDQNGTRTAGHNLTALTCPIGIVCAPDVTDFPDHSIPLYAWPVTNSAFDAAAASFDKRAFLANKKVNCGFGMACMESGGVTTAAVDAATVPSLGGGNTWTGENDFSLATSTRPNRSGTALPTSCRDGETFFKTDAPAGQNLYGCAGGVMVPQAGGSSANAVAKLAPLGSQLIVINPYQSRAHTYKGQLHVHCLPGAEGCSAGDDGTVIGATSVMNSYKSLGYDFVSITSKNGISIPNPAVPGILHIPGAEQYSSVEHMNVWGVAAKISSNTSTAPQAVLDDALANGGVASLNHPGLWTSLPQGGWNPYEAMLLKNLEFFEVCGYSCPEDAFWNALLDAGRRVYGVASDDAKNASGHNFRWVMVNADSLSQQDILAALRAGNFTAHGSKTTAGTAPNLTVGYNESTRTISVSTTAAAGTFTWYKQGASWTKASATSDSYTITGNEGYVRVRFDNAAGWAWSQPIWVTPVSAGAASYPAISHALVGPNHSDTDATQTWSFANGYLASVSASGTTVTVNLNVRHGVQAGQFVYVGGGGNANLRGRRKVTAATTTSMTMAYTSAPGDGTYRDADLFVTGQDTASRGALLVGNSAAKVGLLPLGPAGTFLQSNGTDLLYGGLQVTPGNVPAQNKAGDGTQFQMRGAGAAAAGECAKFDAAGNLISSGAPCGTSSFPADGVKTSQPNTYEPGMKQAFAPNASYAGLNVGQASGDPATLQNGDIWYDSVTNKFRKFEGGAASDLSGGSGGGGGDPCAKYTVAVTGGNWTVNGAGAGAPAAATTQNLSLFTLAARQKISGITMKHSTAFAGTGMTSVTASMGTAASPAIYAPAFDLMQPVSSTAFYDDGGHFSADMNAHTVVLGFTSNTALTNLSAGSLDVWVCTRQLP